MLQLYGALPAAATALSVQKREKKRERQRGGEREKEKDRDRDRGESTLEQTSSILRAHCTVWEKNEVNF